MAEADDWRIWTHGERSRHYGELLRKRATGELPEMQSAIAAARRLKELVKPGDRIADIGCGAGHYYRSIAARLDTDFSYVGVDATPAYLEHAREVHAGDPRVSFEAGDVFDLPFAANSFDVVICNNVLLHLPSIKRPLSELFRISRRSLLIRMLIGERSYRIKEARTDEFNEDGEPAHWHFLNIYSQGAVEKILSQIGVSDFEIDADRDWDGAALNSESNAYMKSGTRTTAIDGHQVGGHIIHPWAFLRIGK